MRAWIFRVALALGAAVFPIPGGALAQTAEEDSVLNRARPDFDVIGIELDEFLGRFGLVSRKAIEQKSSPLSSFGVFPTFGIAGTYESNVFLARDNEVSDRKVVYSPGVSVTSDWASHSLGFSVSGAIGRHFERKGEDFEDVQVQLNGALEILDNQSASASMGFARRHSSRGSEDDPGEGADPIISHNWFANGGFEYSADPLSIRANIKLEYQDYLGSDGVNNDGRDVLISDYKLRLGYEFTPGTTFFVEPNGDIRRFVKSVDSSGLLQDNQAIGALVGITLDTSGVTFLEFGAGVTHRSYDEPSFQSQTNIDFSGKLIWNPTDLVTLTASTGRATAESNTPGESGVLTTSYSMNLDYAFLDNIILNGGLSYSIGDNQELTRIDKDYATNVGVNYFVNDNWSAAFSVTRSWRTSNFDAESFKALVATVSLSGKI